MVLNLSSYAASATKDSELDVLVVGRVGHIGAGEQDVLVVHDHRLGVQPRVSWLALLDGIIRNTDVERILPAHGDVATRNEVSEFASMLRDIYTIVKGAAEQGIPLEQAQQQLTFPQYANWRNYGRLKDEIANIYELVLMKRRSYFE